MKWGDTPGRGCGMPKMVGGQAGNRTTTRNNYGHQCGYQKIVSIDYLYKLLIYIRIKGLIGGEGVRLRLKPIYPFAS